MQRRSLAGALALLLLPAGAALAQTQAPPAGAPAQRRPGLPALRWEAMTPAQRRRVQQRLAAQGRPELSAEEAQRMWDGMTPRQRRAAIRPADGTAQGGRPPAERRPPPQRGAGPAPDSAPPPAAAPSR